MPRSSFRTIRTKAPLVALLAAQAVGVAAGGIGWSCSRHPADPRTPVASLAQTKDAQGSFQTIRARWVFVAPAERLKLEPQLRAFRARFADDPLARVADAYLAMLALEAGRVDEARSMAQSVASGPAGNTRDLGTVVRGALLVRGGEPEQALTVLAPLEGKLLDDFAGELLYEAIVGAAVQAHRWLAAVRYMNAWLQQADEAERRAIRARIDSALRRFPPEALENALEAIRRDPRPDAWDKEMRAAVALRLGQVAVERADARLARSAIETSRSVEGMADAGSELEELASLGVRVPTVAGRTVGLVVPTAQAKLRHRATEAIQGALEVLAPRTTAESDTQPVLRIRESGAELDDVITALDALAQDGASIAIAGFDAEGASAAAGWAEAESMPVILLSKPSRMPEGARFVFVLGEDEGALDASVARAAADSARGPVGRVVPAGSAKADDTVPCDAAAPSAGDPRFPFRSWKAAKVGSIAVTGGVTCAQDAMLELRGLGWAPPVVLGVGALGAKIPSRYAGVVVQAVSGRLGEVRGGALDDATLAAWRGRYGESPRWFEGLGRDGTLLAARSVGVLPTDTTNDQHAVAARRAAVQQALLHATGTLWTTAEPGFEGGRTIRREIRYERVGGK